MRGMRRAGRGRRTATAGFWFEQPIRTARSKKPATAARRTAMVEGLYRGWDEVRTVPLGQQSGLRVIVLFTDGASNSVPGAYDASGMAKGLRSYDFPKNLPDPDGQTWNNPTI